MPFGVEFAFVYEEQVLSRFALDPGEYQIGRAPECEIAIDLDGIGFNHAKLTIGDRLTLSDLGDESGTFIGRRRLISPEELRPGMDIQLGTAGILRVESWTRSESESAEADDLTHSPSEEVELEQLAAEIGIADDSDCLGESPVSLAEGPVGLTEGPVGLTEGPVGLTEGPACLTEGPAGLDEGPAGLAEGPAGLTEGPADLTEGPAGLAEGPAGPTESSDPATEGIICLSDVAEQDMSEVVAAKNLEIAPPIDAKFRTLESRVVDFPAESICAAPDSSLLEFDVAECTTGQQRDVGQIEVALSTELEAAPDGSLSVVEATFVETRSHQTTAETQGDRKRRSGKQIKKGKARKRKKEAKHFPAASIEDANVQTTAPVPDSLIEWQAPISEEGEAQQGGVPTEPFSLEISATEVFLETRDQNAREVVSEGQPENKALQPSATPPTPSNPVEAPPKKDQMEAEIYRLRRTLVDEMDRRRRAEKWVTEIPAVAAPVEEEEVGVKTNPRKWYAGKVIPAAAALVLTSVSVWLVASKWAGKRAEEVRTANLAVSALRPAADQFVAAAEKFVGEQEWEAATQQLGYALTLAPDRAPWLSRLGDVLLTQFKFEDALAAYRRASEINVRLADPWDGITVCERLLRANEVSGSPSTSAMYSVHRTLVRHGRMAEAIKVAGHLPDDADLQQRTWQLRLQKGGLDADVRLNEARKLTVRLKGAVQENLELIRGIPAVAIWMPETDVNDLTPLTGLRLVELDISRTMVSKVDALRDMPLRQLNLDRTQVEDLLPLRGSPIEELHLSRTPVKLISSLRSMPLRKLDISYTKVSDLQPLATVPLREIDASGTPVSDLAPLVHLPLNIVRLDDTRVADLTPLRGSPITVLSVARTSITSVEPLTQTPLTVLNLSGCSQLRDLRPLAGLKDLQKFILPNRASTKDVRAILPQVRFIE